MLKIIPVSALLLLSFMSVQAQVTQNGNGDNAQTTSSNGNNTDSDPTDATDPTTSGNDTTATPTTTDTTGVTTSTPATTPSATNGTTATPVTTTPVTTTPTPVTTTTPTDSTTTAPATTTPATTTTTTTTTTSTPVTAFACVGNNPTWNLSIASNLISFSSAPNTTVRIRAVTPISPAGDTSGDLQVWSARTDTNRPVTILVKRNSVGCTNGAPGQTYSFDAYVVFSNRVVAGCCNPS